MIENHTADYHFLYDGGIAELFFMHRSFLRVVFMKRESMPFFTCIAGFVYFMYVLRMFDGVCCDCDEGIF